MKSVIPSTGIPFRRATREWDSSWARREEKKSSAPTTPIPRYAPRDSPGKFAGKTATVNVHRMRKKMMNHEKSMRISKPKTEPSRKSPMCDLAASRRCWYGTIGRDLLHPGPAVPPPPPPPGAGRARRLRRRRPLRTTPTPPSSRQRHSAPYGASAVPPLLPARPPLAPTRYAYGRPSEPAGQPPRARPAHRSTRQPDTPPTKLRPAHTPTHPTTSSSRPTQAPSSYRAPVLVLVLDPAR